MLAAVAPDSRYENLRDYVIANGAGGRPTAVRAFDQSARQPLSLPTDALPGVKTPIPTSSARPGKQTNQRVTYARVSFNFAILGSNYQTPVIEEGDICFVHRPMNSNGVFTMPGHGPNRSSTVGNLLQINDELSRHNAENRGMTTMAPQENPFGILEVPEIDPLTGVQRLDPSYTPPRPVFRETTWTERWANCKTIGRWSVDGVVCGTEHGHGGPHPMVGQESSNAGDLYNICVQGPTPLKNNPVSPTDLSNKFKEQNVDNGPRVLDKVFVGLFAQENRDPITGRNLYYSYSWKPFTSRQLLYIDLAGTASLRVACAPGSMNVSCGPTAGDFVRLVAAFRIGSVMDNKLTDSRLFLNVIVEEWPLDWLRDSYNALVGASLTLRMRSVGNNVQSAVQLLERAGTLLADGSPNKQLLRRAFELNDQFGVSDAMASSTDPFGFGTTLSALEAEVDAYTEWRRARQVFQDAKDVGMSAKERRTNRITDPGPEPSASIALVTFFEKMTNYNPVVALLDVLYVDRNSTDVAEDTVDIARVASFTQDREIYDSLTSDEKDLVAQAEIVSAMFAKLSGPLELYRRIDLYGYSMWAQPAPGFAGLVGGDAAAGGGEADDGGFGV